jgi:tetratricopeptide (TPR) repeat protein
MKYNFLLKILFIFILLNSALFSMESNYLDEGIKLFKSKEFEKSKIFFEKDIVFNPKSEKSYLYLAKIFHENEDDALQEVNLNNVLLLNPNNDEAIYMLAVLEIKNSDYDKAKALIEKFNLVCESFCSKKKEMKESFSKLVPTDDKEKN